MSTAGRSSKLDPHAEEILTLHRQGRSLDAIAKHLAGTHKVSTALSTLSDFIKRNGAPAPASAPAGRELTEREQSLLGEAEVYAEIRGAIMLLAADVQAMRTALPTLGAEAGQAIAKQTAMLETLLRERKGAAQAVVEPSPAGSAAMSSPERLPAVPQLAPAGAMPVPAATLRQVWIRAFWGVTGLWFLVAVLTYALGFWQVGR